MEDKENLQVNNKFLINDAVPFIQLSPNVTSVTGLHILPRL